MAIQEAINAAGKAVAVTKNENGYLGRRGFGIERVAQWTRRLKRRSLFQKVIIVNTLLIAIGCTVGIFLENRYLSGNSGLGQIAVFINASVLLSILINYLLIKLAFRPLDDVTKMVKIIQTGDRGVRIPEVADDPQIGELSKSLNAMLKYMEKQRKLGAASVIRAQEEERKRIARELHDETSQSLTGLVIGIKIAEELLPPDLVKLRERLYGIKNLAHVTLNEIHTMAIRLRPSVLDDLGLPAALRSFVKEFGQNTGIATKLEMVAITKRLPHELEMVLYRVVQEALTNIARHSGASSCSVRLERQDSKIKGVISDNGCGFDVSAVMMSNESEGLGLHGMEERTELVGGLIRFYSHPDMGTTVYLEVPNDKGGR
jgi:two-component system sensor histidine kinase UhpB